MQCAHTDIDMIMYDTMHNKINFFFCCKAAVLISKWVKHWDTIARLLFSSFCAMNFGRVAVSRRDTSIVHRLRWSPRIISRLGSAPFLFFPSSFFLSCVMPTRRTNVRRLRLAPVREESAIGVAGKESSFKWLPCSFTSARRPKCGWDSGRRDALLPEATANARRRLRNKEKKNQRIVI